MKNSILILALITAVWAGCGPTGSVNRFPAEDREVYSILEKLKQNPGIVAYIKELDNQYQSSLLKHQQVIAQYNQSNQLEKWEKIMNEYGKMEKMAEAIAALPAVSKSISIERFQSEYAASREKAVEEYYQQAKDFLNESERQSAQQAFSLLTKVNQWAPGYKDVSRLMQIADEKSVLKIVINPVNYYSHNYGYYGLNNDYVQQEIVRDLRFQLQSGHVRVYSSWEARSANVVPDRLIDIEWNELFLPLPRSQTFTRQVSRTIQTGETADKKPIYATVSATLYITRRTLETRARLSCKVYDPTNNRVVLWDEFPVNNNAIEESATFTGDSRALSSYDWALVNNASFRDLSQYDMFNNVFQRVYPQLLDRLRMVTW